MDAVKALMPKRLDAITRAMLNLMVARAQRND
jgi:hypothetical protein